MTSLQATKWLFCQVLLEVEEMRALLKELSPFAIYLTGCVTRRGEEQLSQETFLATYARYLAALKASEPCDEEMRRAFSSVFTRDKESLFSLPLEDGKQLMRIKSPVIQLQMHQIGYSKEENKFRPMVLGKDSISWGIQFSYPGLYQNHTTGEALATKGLPNTELFRTLQKWVRHNTLPTPFIVGEKQINVPMRLGKQCTGWIETHPQLQRQNIRIQV